MISVSFDRVREAIAQFRWRPEMGVEEMFVLDTIGKLITYTPYRKKILRLARIVFYFFSNFTDENCNAVVIDNAFFSPYMLENLFARVYAPRRFGKQCKDLKFF